MDLSIFDKEELFFINIISSFVVSQDKLTNAIHKYFYNIRDVKEHITFWDTTNITNMSNIFAYKTKFNELLFYGMLVM